MKEIWGVCTSKNDSGSGIPSATLGSPGPKPHFFSKAYGCILVENACLSGMGVAWEAGFDSPQHCINQAWVLVLKGWRQEDQTFKVILDYIASLRLAWATRAPLSKTKTKEVGGRRDALLLAEMRA